LSPEGSYYITIECTNLTIRRCTFFSKGLYFFVTSSVFSKKGNLVRFNSHSVGNYASAQGSQQVIVEELAVGLMLDYSPENLCEVLLQGDVIFNIDPDNLDVISTDEGFCV
jgi:hypothetical protein